MCQDDKSSEVLVSFNDSGFQDNSYVSMSSNFKIHAYLNDNYKFYYLE